MKKALFIFIMFAMTLQIAFAQRGRMVIIYFHSGSVIKGELSKVPNEEKFRLQTPDGGIVLFTSQEVRDVLYEDGTRPGANQPQYRQQQPQQQQPQQQYQQRPPQQQYQQQQQQQQGVRPQNNGATRVDPKAEEEEIYDDEEEYYDDDEYYDDSETEYIDETPARSRQAKKEAAPEAPDLSFRPGYHGFVDFGYTIGLGDSTNAFSRMEFTITQGYQLTSALFVGIGTGAHLYSDSVKLNKIVDGKQVDNCYLSYVFPVFVDVRYNFSNGTIRPFGAIKAGYSLGLSKTSSETLKDGVTSRRTEYKAETLGFYIAPSVGAKFQMGPIALNIGVGYTMQTCNSETFKANDTNVKISKMNIMGGVTLKAGLEF
ncbi:MAG: hypothetical protein LBJ58_00465 [Tannerellaceae bacterium]|jgi:hypothetical protein|nr:hypothetical protein [Tannerellaceae bacterium]